MSDTARLQADLQRLVGEPAARKLLARIPAAQPISAGVGSARPAQPGGGLSAGIASPLSEPLYSQREHYAETTLTSTDGLFTFKAKRLKKIVMSDANGARVELLFAAPA